MTDLDKLQLWLELAIREGRRQDPDGVISLSTKKTEKQLDIIYDYLAELLDDPEIQPIVKRFDATRIILNSKIDVDSNEELDQVLTKDLPPSEPLPAAPTTEPPTTEPPTTEPPTDQSEPYPVPSGPSIVAKMAKRALSKH